MRRRRSPVVVLVAGLVFAVLTAGWLLVAVPALVKYPTNIDERLRYEGTLTLYVNPATAAPLATPLEVPLRIERRVEALGDESGSSKVVVRETITQAAEGVLDAHQTNVYVMDRSSLKNVADDRAYSFEPDNIVDRSPNYRLNLPFGTRNSKRYSIYKNETAATYLAEPATEHRRAKEAGLELDRFTASIGPTPLDPAYLAQLNQVVPLPQSLTLAQLEPQLRAAGVDVAATTSALLPVLSPADLATLVTVTSRPVPIEYVLSFDGELAIEPVTGAEVHVTATESVGAKPTAESLAALQQILGRYPNVAAAATASRGLTALAQAPPIPVFRFSYDQTPASVESVADAVKSLRSRILLAQVWIPLALGVISVVLLVAALIVRLVGRRRSDADVDADGVPPATTDLGTPPGADGATG